MISRDEALLFLKKSVGIDYGESNSYVRGVVESVSDTSVVLNSFGSPVVVSLEDINLIKVVVINE